MQLSDNRQKTIEELAIDKKLNEPITLNLNDQSLGEAIAFIQNYTGLNVILDPKALNDEGLSRDSKVTLTANSIKLKTALKFMLRPLGLTYKAEEGVLLITSPQASRDKTYTWTYPVADLVVPPSKPTAPPTASGLPNISGVDPSSLQAMALANCRPERRRQPVSHLEPADHHRHRHDAADPAHHLDDRAEYLADHRHHGRRGRRSLRDGRSVRWRSRRSGRRDRPARLDHAVPAQHQPDHPPYGGGPRGSRRAAQAAPSSSGLAGLDRGPVHHRER